MLENFICCLKSCINCYRLFVTENQRTEIRERRTEGSMGTIRTRYMSGEDERQYMIGEDYEIYEKRGAPTGAVRLHYHDFYEVIYVMEGEFSSLVDNRTYNLKRGDFL